MSGAFRPSSFASKAEAIPDIDFSLLEVIVIFIGTLKITLRAAWVHSLKEKRMVVKSICGKAKDKFNISIAEVEQQDVHQTIVIGICAVTDEIAHCDSILDNVLNYIEAHTEAEVIDVEREIF